MTAVPVMSGCGAQGQRRHPAARQRRRLGAAASDGRVHPRSAALEVIQRDGLKAWKQQIGDHRRSLAETAMGRIKGLFGKRLQARSWERQVNECYLCVAAMNRMTGLGMPVSQVVHR